MRSKRLLFRLVPSMPRTDGTEFGLWRTPNGQEPGIDPARLCCKDGSYPKPGQRLYDRESGRLAQVGLTQAVKLWPSPRHEGFDAGAHKGNPAPQLPEVMGGQLNPDWVEWLMNFPVGWTDIGPTARKASRRSAAESRTERTA